MRVDRSESDLLPRMPEGIPRYRVAELNQAIGHLLDRGFAPRFLVEATVSRPQLKKGHLWLTLTDEEASIQAVVWASQLPKLSFQPGEGDGVLVVGRLNFWTARASLSVQVLDLRPSLSAVLRQFERVRDLLAPEGLFDRERKRPLPLWPRRIAILTSVPSSALADMLRTARERWPATAILLVPIPVQGAVEERILGAIEALAPRAASLGVEALILARGGGSREDLTVFDGAALARGLAACPVPVVCGLGHEDDTTIADLVADYRAATPTAAVVALLPDRAAALQGLEQTRRHLREVGSLRLESWHRHLARQRQELRRLHPFLLLAQKRELLNQQRKLLRALSPQHLLERGFSLVRDARERLVRSASSLQPGDRITVQLVDGRLDAQVLGIEGRPQDPSPPAAAPQGKPAA